MKWDRENFHRFSILLVLGKMITFKEMCQRLYFYVQSEQFRVQVTQSLSCFLCDNNQNIPIHHNTKCLWLYFEWFKLGLLTFNTYTFPKEDQYRFCHLSLWMGVDIHAVLAIMPYISPIDVGNEPRHPWAVCSHDVPCPVFVKENGEWTDGWLIICRALQPWGFGGPTCCKCCAEKRTKPRIFRGQREISLRHIFLLALLNCAGLLNQRRVNSLKPQLIVRSWG